MVFGLGFAAVSLGLAGCDMPAIAQQIQPETPTKDVGQAVLGTYSGA
jgi:hypothetical protein